MAVRFEEDLLARAVAYVGQDERQRRITQAGRNELLDLYNEITGERRGWCPACQYTDFFNIVRAYIRQATTHLHPETMSESKYQFAPGFENETLVHEAYSEAITADNLTDEAAKFFIEQGFHHVIVAKPKAEKAADEKKSDAPAAHKPKADAK